MGWKLSWAQSRYRKEKPNLQDISDWLKERYNLINSACVFPTQTNHEKRDVSKDSWKSNWKNKYKKENLLNTVTRELKPNCIFCKENDHYIQNYKSFTFGKLQKLRNTTVGSQEILIDLPKDLRIITKEFDPSANNEIQCERVLGMMWNVYDDILAFSSKFNKVKTDL